MNARISIFLFVIVFIAACTGSHEIRSEDIIMKEGVYMDASSGEILDGRYIVKWTDDSVYSFETGENSMEQIYSGGVPIGKWVHKVNDTVISAIKYLNVPALEHEIEELVGCQRVDIYYSGSQYKLLNIQCVNAQNMDSLQAQRVGELTEKAILSEYPFISASIALTTDSTVHYFLNYNVK